MERNAADDWLVLPSGAPERPSRIQRPLTVLVDEQDEKAESVRSTVSVRSKKVAISLRSSSGEEESSRRVVAMRPAICWSMVRASA